MQKLNNEALANLARTALSFGMSVGEAARIMAQDMATPERRQKECKAQYREFVKFHNRKRGRA